MEKKEISGYGEGNYFFGSGNTGWNNLEVLRFLSVIRLIPFIRSFFIGHSTHSVHSHSDYTKSLKTMAALKFADYLQRSISLFLFGTTLFAGFMTVHNIRRRRQARALATDEQTKHEVYQQYRIKRHVLDD